MHSRIIIIIFVGLISLANTKTTFIVLKAPKCDKYNRNYFANVSLVYRSNKLSVELELIKTLLPGLTLNMDFFSRNSQSKSFSHFYQYSLDVCRMLAKRKRNIFMNLFSNIFQHGNFQKYCPVHPNYYYTKDFNIKELDVPTFLFAGYYRLTLHTVQFYSQTKVKDFLIDCEMEVQIK